MLTEYSRLDFFQQMRRRMNSFVIENGQVDISARDACCNFSKTKLQVEIR